ncbi:hypothetical protein OIE68_16760 [Nocardia vinacea]|uniref:hypothetical protein n=1 Tax=Nocardia vinacea TaxID=96468 RepID=UPI002E11D8E8|nr:hypothetical protein OIE68_16760 [Nocardia vinacea]
MTSLRKVPWDVTEEALRLLNLTVADFASLPPVKGGRWSGASGAAKWARFDPRQIRFQSQYLRMVSIVEAYVDTVSEALFDRRVESLDSFFKNLAVAIQDISSASWNERKNCFKAHHGFSLQSCSGWSEFDRAIDVRNSIAHGLGVVTKKQLDSNKDKKIRLAKVKITDGRIEVTKDSLRVCSTACAMLIKSIDDNLPHP